VGSSRFAHDEDEELLTTPRYRNTSNRISLNLRSYLANAIYRKEVAAGTDPRKIVFSSIHTDALFNPSIRGAMLYIPGARLRHRRGAETPKPLTVYARYAEVRGHRDFNSTPAKRRNDEALSRSFATILYHELGKKRIKRHDAGPAIRAQIRREGGVEYVPGVLRNNDIPAKVLVECANMTNATDCSRIANPKWRQWFAEAYVNALRQYFGSAK
jgi:N-acetylmuramoyl-L-alanine amidase